MYSKYPFPFGGNHGNYFQRHILPAIQNLRKEQPIEKFLEAGCGTGNVTADICSFLPDLHVTAVDITDESLSIARKISAERGSKNVTFKKSNLMEYDATLGTYDFIYCQGVIHHLSDPLAGMMNLNRYLKNGHYAFVWLYSLLGRTRVLEMREALKIMGVDKLDWESKIQLAMDTRPLFLNQPLTFIRKIIKVLEHLETRGLKATAQMVTQHAAGPASEAHTKIHTADYVLHPQDKYYRFGEAYELFEKSGFEFVSILQGMSNSLDESFKNTNVFKGKQFSKLDTYKLIELHERPEGLGYLVRKKAEVPR